MDFIIERNSFPTHCCGRELVCFGGKANRDKYAETIIGDVVYPIYGLHTIYYLLVNEDISYYYLFHPYIVIDKKIEVSSSSRFDDDSFYIGVGKVYFHDKYGKITKPLGTYSHNLDEAINKNLLALSNIEGLCLGCTIEIKQKLEGFKKYLENFKEK